MESAWKRKMIFDKLLLYSLIQFRFFSYLCSHLTLKTYLAMVLTGMCKTTIYSLLFTLFLALQPAIGAAVPQTNVDITKPTRERVKSDKKDTKSTSSDKKNDKKNEEAKPVEKKDEKTADKKDNVKTAPVKVETAGAAKTDTATKPAPPKPKARPALDPGKVQLDGIDVSKHQGYINWNEIKEIPKIKFVYIKATEGTDLVDSRYRENILNARKNGIKVGSYHFLSTSSAVTSQFQNFIRTAKREDQDLIPVIDVEKIKPWNSQQLRDSLKVFADLLEDYYGCKPMIYTSEKFFTTNLGRAFADYPLFIAKYSSTPPSIGYKWIIWQFADNGVFKSAVKANNGLVDMSRFNKDCNINDILYKPGKHTPRKSSVKDAVDHKEKPTTVNMTEEKPKEAPKPSKKQQEESKRKAEKEKKAKERNKKIAEDEAKKKAEADKKAKEKAEQLKKEKERQQAREAAAKKEAEEKAKRKAAAQKAREEKAKQNASKGSSKKTASLLSNQSSKLTQSQRNDSIRKANLKGRKTNKSSADND